MAYKEIEQLKALVNKYKVKCEVAPEKGNLSSLTPVRISIGSSSFIIYVDDEYGDLQTSNSLLHVFLALNELENYQESEDYLGWCNDIGLDPLNDQLRRYYMDLAGIYTAITKVIGRPDPFISSFDLQLNAGPIQELRSLDT